MSRKVPTAYAQMHPNERPIYTYAQASRYLGIPLATLKSWVQGRTYPTRRGPTASAPLINNPANALSFNQLVQLHVLRALRTSHAIELTKVRSAISYAQERLHIQHLLLSQELLTAGGDRFIERYGHLISLTRAGQLALRELLQDHLRRIEWRADLDLPQRLYPFTSNGSSSKQVALDPEISFGQPTVHGIKTSVIFGRINAGEDTQQIAQDYGLDLEAITEAIKYELKIAA